MTSNNKEPDRIGARLREEREYRGYSEKEIAEYLEISRSSLSAMEDGEKEIEKATVNRLADLYNMTTSALLSNEHAETERANNGGSSIDLLARKKGDLSEDDKREIRRFADFLKSRQPRDGNE